MGLEQAPNKLSTKQAILAMVGISSGLMLSALDQTVIGNALPSIVADLDGFDLYAWVATGYLLMSIVTIPIFGRLGDYYGRKPFIVVACAVFTLASFACALAGNIYVLVIARALQGLGGGMLIGTAFASIPDLFPDNKERLKWQIFLSSAFSIVNALGAPLGGFLTDAFGWRSIFYLNIPLGCLAVFCAWQYIPWVRHTKSRDVSLDWLGALLIALALASFQLFIEQVPKSGLSPLVILLACVLLTATVCLVYRERRIPHPLLPPALFVAGSVRTLFVLSMLAGSVMFSLLYYTPLMFQGALGYSSQQAGILITPMVLSITLGAIINSKVIRHLHNPNWLPRGGFLLLAIACFGLAFSDLNTGFYLLLFFMLLAGCGLGFTLINLTLFTQNSVEKNHLGIATALLQSLRLVGGMLGTAITGSFIHFLYHQTLEKALINTGERAYLTELSDPNILLQAKQLAPSKLPLETAQQALLDALNLGWLALAVISLIALCVLWRVKPIILFK
ncbi:MFS transporter [Marinomonas transparens]|uniref:MFS transporter n=1 Tax=Marinomonas transparens TaxID=2795388 RepID=A0A934JLZ0_9GAMM|nr:MFS transporter [Marinomonas transparens]MBJ7538620.1 MFS transporter [Marinomonas transparens]